MPKFITLTQNDDRGSVTKVNVDQIVYYMPTAIPGVSFVATTSDVGHLHVKESVSAIDTLIAS